MKWTENNTNENIYFAVFCEDDYLDMLKAQLKQAEYAEDYELCADIRDEINKIVNSKFEMY
jgi:protein-arginine kinase activator protein McsA